MNFTKTLVAAALLVGATSANAELIGGFFNNDGSSELFLQVYNPNFVNPDATLGATFNFDTNVSFNQLRAVATSGDFSALNSLLSISLASDANFQTFIAQNNAGPVKYYLGVGTNSPGDVNVGVFETLTTPAPQIDGNDPTVIPNAAADNIQLRAAGVAIGLGSNQSAIIPNTPVNPFRGQANEGSFSLDNAINTFPGVQGATQFGNSIDFRYVFGRNRTFIDPLFGDEVTTITFNAAEDQLLLGQFTLTAQGLSFTAEGGQTAVPLPAAVWMFGAGLMGVLRLNRRKAA
ncbi:MAG: hypothetical protein CTY18_01500 [Methylomonas sp.]|nr:MAG: hypothetical protein CTY18_01500 [Methylomonas sp.]